MLFCILATDRLYLVDRSPDEDDATGRQGVRTDIMRPDGMFAVINLWRLFCFLNWEITSQSVIFERVRTVAVSERVKHREFGKNY